MKKLTSFTVMADLKIATTIIIEAESLEDAVLKSKELRVEDFVDVQGELMDGEVKLTGVYE